MSALIDNIKIKEYFILYTYLYIFLLPWNFFKWQAGILTAILFAWWILRYKKEIIDNFIKVFNFKPVLLLLLFVFYSYISVLWSSSFENGLDHVNKFHKYYIFIIFPLFLSLKPKDAFNCIKILIFSFGIYAIFSLSIFAGLFSIDSTNSDINNPKGIMAYAIMSVFMAIGVLLSFFIARLSKINYERNMFYIISVLCFFALFVNNSRTAQIALLLTMFIILIIYFRKKVFKFYNMLILLSVIIITIFVSIQFLKDTGKLNRYISAYNETAKIINENKYEGSFGARVYFNIAGFNVFKEEPILGSGPEDNIIKLIQYQKNDNRKIFPKIYKSYHSQHIDTLTRYGIIGYLLIVLSALYLIISLRKYKEIYYMALSFFLLVFFSSFANVMLIKKPFNYVYITLFVLLSVIAYNQNKKESKNDELY